MKVYVLTMRDDTGDYTPRVYWDLKSAQNGMKDFYNEKLEEEKDNIDDYTETVLSSEWFNIELKDNFICGSIYECDIEVNENGNK